MEMNNNGKNGIRTFIPKDSREGKNKDFLPSQMKVFEVVDYLQTNTEKGISLQEAKKRRKKHGMNLLFPEFKRTFVTAFSDHIKAVTSVLLSVSLFIFYAFYGNYEYLLSALIISISILTDCVLEHFASIRLNNAKKGASLRTSVKRNGNLYSTDSKNLVPGDIVYLKKGSIVPADLRLFDSNGLVVYETPITGSQYPVKKIARDNEEISESLNETPINMALAGSIVCEGNAWGIVCFTGVRTKFTSIPKNKHNNVPSIFKYVYSVSSMLSILSAFLGALMLVGGLFFSTSLSSTFLFSLSIAACSLCDSVVSFSALSLSEGMVEMKRNGAVLRSMSSIDSLAFVDSFLAHQNTIFPVQKTELERTMIGTDDAFGDKEKQLIRYFLLCSDVKKILMKNSGKGAKLVGKPNEITVANYAETLNITLESVQDDFLITEVENKENSDFTSLLAYENGQKYFFVKGSPLEVIPLCKYHDTIHGLKIIEEDDISTYEDFVYSNSNETGYLVAVAKCETAIDRISDYEDRRVLTLCGFIKFKTYFGIDYFEHISDAHDAGVEVCMFSNDAYLKAYNLGKNSGIFKNRSEVIAEEELRYLSMDEFEKKLSQYKVFIKFAPSLFDFIVSRKKQQGKIVAVSAETTDDLTIMKNSNVSFVVDGESSEMIKQSSDVILSAGGFERINKVISTSKKIYRRIHSLCEYCVYNYISIFFLYLFSNFFGIEYRVYDFLVNSVLVSGLICLFIATVPVRNKYKNDFPVKRKKMVSPISLVEPSVLGIVCALCCGILSSAFSETASHSVSLIGFSSFSLFSAISIFNDGRPIFERFLGFNWNTLITVVTLTLEIVLLIVLPSFGGFSLYENVTFIEAAVSAVIPALFCVFIPIMKSIFNILKKV